MLGGSAGKRSNVGSLSDAPGDVSALESGPTVRYLKRKLYRVCSDRYAHPWYFANNGTGRFDQPRSSFHGTCYFGSTMTASMREKLGPTYRSDHIVHEDFFAKMKGWIVVPKRPAPSRIANLRRNWWLGHGLTSEIFSTPSYDLPNNWADAFRRAKFEGLIYSLRLGLDPRRFGLALFGIRGGHDSDERFLVLGGRGLRKRDFDKFSRESQISIQPGSLSYSSFIRIR
jgi:hypothetical protein